MVVFLISLYRKFKQTAFISFMQCKISIIDVTLFHIVRAQP